MCSSPQFQTYPPHSAGPGLLSSCLPPSPPLSPPHLKLLSSGLGGGLGFSFVLGRGEGGAGDRFVHWLWCEQWWQWSWRSVEVVDVGVSTAATRVGAWLHVLAMAHLLGDGGVVW